MNRTLYKLFKGAEVVDFNKESKIVFISDVHRGDGTFCDSLLGNRNIYLSALKYYLKNDFIYVEVGDGDELWKNKDYREIAYEYDEVFSLLNKFKKKNQLYMIYGNHDIIKRNKNFAYKYSRIFKKASNNYGSEFVNFVKETEFHEALNFMYKPLMKKFMVIHGHQVDIKNNQLWIFNMLLVRYIWKFMYGIGGFKDPTSSAKSNTKRSLEDIKLQKWCETTGNMLICGHSHNSRFPEVTEPPYFNDGCCVLPYSMTSIEIENGLISLIKWEISAKDTGELAIKRKVIGGPADITNYLNWIR